MNEVFADTSGWANLHVPSQPFYRLARKIVRRWSAGGHRVITANYVLAELVALLTRPLRVSRPLQLQILQTIRTSPGLTVVHVDPPLDAAAWMLLENRLDKEWSLADCASFVVMQQRGITEALTTDQHFEQAGFVRLLK